MPRIIIHPDGRREVAEEPTEAPQLGAAPRLADGTVVGTDGLPLAAPHAATAAKPAARRRRASPPAAPAEPAPAAPVPDPAPAQPEEA